MVIMENETSVGAHELVVVAHLVAALAFLASTHPPPPCQLDISLLGGSVSASCQSS